MNPVSESNILVVDDNVELAHNLVDVLQLVGYRAGVAVTADEALAYFKENEPDIALVDINLPDVQGPDLVQQLHDLSPGTEVIYITGNASLESAIEAVRQEHVVSYETKPLDLDRVLFLLKQITKRRGAEKTITQLNIELQQRIGELEELARAKQDFLANVSHELRTPLTSIYGYLRLIQTRHQDSVQGKVPRWIDTMAAEANRLMGLIDSLLFFARWEGHIVLERTVVDLTRLASTVVEQLQPIADTAAVTLKLDTEPSGIEIKGDLEKLARVISNLATNSLKFCAAGGTVEVVVRPTQFGGEIVVSDTGIGIAEADLERIFERFVQVDSGPRRAYQGSGLGLSIVTEIVLAHGGTISVSSLEDEGTAFCIELPREGQTSEDE